MQPNRRDFYFIMFFLLSCVHVFLVYISIMHYRKMPNLEYQKYSAKAALFLVNLLPGVALGDKGSAYSMSATLCKTRSFSQDLTKPLLSVNHGCLAT